MERVVSLCLCVVLLLEVAVAVNSTGGPSSQGTEFILGFLENEKDDTQPEDKVALIITTLSDTPGAVTVSAPLFNESWIENINVSRDGAAVVRVPPDIRGSGTEKSTKGIWVQSTETVSVFAVNMEELSTGAFLCLPINVLGQEYYAVTYIAKAELMVVATQNDTQVSIEWPDGTGSINIDFEGVTYRKGSTLNVTLDKFETLHISQDSRRADFTGAYVTSDKPIAVLSGNRKVTVPNDGGTADHLAAMLIPVNSWGNEFVTTSTPDRSVGDVYRIVASEDDTTIRFSDNLTLKISEAGEFREVQLATGSYQVMTSDKPIMVAMFSKDFEQDGPNKGDPSMSLLIPETQYASEYAWSTLTDTAGQDFHNKLSVIIERRKMSGLQLNGSSVQWRDQKAVIGSNKIHLWAYVSPGFYELLHSDPSVTFMTMVSGTARFESYLFLAGMRMCIPSATVAGDLVDNDCDGRVDEELWNNVDDDDDGKIDEDVAKSPRASQPTHNCTDLDYIPENGTVTCTCSVEYIGDPPGNLTWLLRDTAIDTGENGVTELPLPSQFLTREYDFTQLVCQVKGSMFGCAMLPLHIAYGPDKVELVKYQHYDVNTSTSLTIFHCEVTGMNPVSPDMVQWEGPCRPDGFSCTVDPALSSLRGESVRCRVTNDKNGDHFAEDVKPIRKVPVPDGVGIWPVLGTLLATNLATLLCSIMLCCETGNTAVLHHALL